jgi:hypothetical protein
LAAHRKCATGERENNHDRYPGDRALVAYRHVSNGSRRSWVYRGQERSLQRRCHSYPGGPTPYSPRNRPPPRYPSSSVMTITVSSECVCAVSPMHGTSSPRGHRPNLTTLANHLWRPPREYRPHCLRERQTERRPVSQCCRAAPKGRGRREAPPQIADFFTGSSHSGSQRVQKIQSVHGGGVVPKFSIGSNGKPMKASANDREQPQYDRN